MKRFVFGLLIIIFACSLHAQSIIDAVIKKGSIFYDNYPSAKPKLKLLPDSYPIAVMVSSHNFTVKGKISEKIDGYGISLTGKVMNKTFNAATEYYEVQLFLDPQVTFQRINWMEQKGMRFNASTISYPNVVSKGVLNHTFDKQTDKTIPPTNVKGTILLSANKDSTFIRCEALQDIPVKIVIND